MEGNVEELKCGSMSRQENAGQNRILKIINKFLMTLTEVTYLGRAVNPC